MNPKPHANGYTSKTGLSRHTLTAHEALQNSPTLSQLTARVRESSQRLEAIQSLIPESLRPAIQAGPIEGESWCLLVNGNAAAAKVRQLMPLILSRLLGKGWKVTSIRLKILIGPKR